MGEAMHPCHRNKQLMQTTPQAKRVDKETPLLNNQTPCSAKRIPDRAELDVLPQEKTSNLHLGAANGLEAARQPPRKQLKIENVSEAHAAHQNQHVELTNLQKKRILPRQRWEKARPLIPARRGAKGLPPHGASTQATRKNHCSHPPPNFLLGRQIVTPRHYDQICKRHQKNICHAV